MLGLGFNKNPFYSNRSVLLFFLSLAERARAEACEREAELQRQKREEIQRQAQDKERSYELHKKQLEDKLYYDRIKLQADQERVLAQKLQVTVLPCSKYNRAN